MHDFRVAPTHTGLLGRAEYQAIGAPDERTGASAPESSAGMVVE